MLDGETVLSGAPHPGTTLQVLQSGGSYYLGFIEKNGAPYTRETDYMTQAQAQVMLRAFRA